MKFFVVSLLLFVSVLVRAQSDSTAKEVFTMVETMPEFPDGNKEMVRYIKRNLKYPQSAIDNKISGKIFLRFTVNADGSLSNFLVVKGVDNCTDCDEAAINVVRSMPKWRPATQGGKNVACYFNLPINFAR